jgi:hypothetical protein
VTPPLFLIGGDKGFKPICIYGRKARLPLAGDLEPDGMKISIYSLEGTNRKKTFSKYMGYVGYKSIRQAT